MGSLISCIISGKLLVLSEHIYLLKEVNNTYFYLE